MSLVPDAVRDLRILSAAQYQPLDKAGDFAYRRALGREQVELVAGRVSAINECFYTLIHETHKFNGAAELLDILASIISGFAVPLRDEHVIFFKNVIIPLHKVQTCS